MTRPDGHCEIVQHLRRDRSQQEAPQGRASVRRQHHQIGSLVLHYVMDDGSRFADPGVQLQMHIWKMGVGEFLQPLCNQCASLGRQFRICNR